jgi:hypothetical protein
LPGCAHHPGKSDRPEKKTKSVHQEKSRKINRKSPPVKRQLRG